MQSINNHQPAVYESLDEIIQFTEAGYDEYHKRRKKKIKDDVDAHESVGK